MGLNSDAAFHRSKLILKIYRDVMKKNGVCTENLDIFCEGKTPISLAFLDENNEVNLSETATGDDILKAVTDLKTDFDLLKQQVDESNGGLSILSS